MLTVPTSGRSARMFSAAGSAARQRRGPVRREVALPVGEVDRLRRTESSADLDIVVQDVEVAETRHRECCHCLHGFGFGDIGEKGQRLTALRPSVRRKRLGLIRVAVHQNDPGTCPREWDGGRGAIARTLRP